jgi:hypothetical protein
MFLDSRNLIFSINSGRSGSRYLAELLATADNIQAFHEAEPTMSGVFLQMVTSNPPADSFRERSIKAGVIRQILDRLPAGTGYAETNHMFIKTFSDVVMEAFQDCNIHVIVLRRYLPAVLKSFINMGYFSARNRVWPAWMHLPGTCGSAFIPLESDQVPDQYDLAIGYLLDIEARVQQFRMRYPDCVLVETSLEALQDIESIEALFAGLHIHPTERTRDMTGRITNQRVARKAQIGIETTLEYCQERIDVYLENCAKHGVAVPPLPQLEL